MTGMRLSALEVLTTQERGGLRARENLLGAASIAQRLEQLGYHRVWYPEHHRSTYAADFPPGIVVAHVAQRTRAIRVGSGGVLAPNHSPLTLSEQFGTLAALHPGRIDMGVGRGPGTLERDVARVLRRGADPATDDEYRADVEAVLRYAAERAEVPEPWLLASSAAGAVLAAELGLPVAFAHHLRPANAGEALERYRAAFTPSRWSESPRVMLCVQAVCAETDQAAHDLARPAWVWRATAQADAVNSPLPDPAAAARHVFSAKQEAVLESLLPHAAEGGPETVGKRLVELGDSFAADELMVMTPVHDVTARMRSFDLIAEALPQAALG